MIKVPKVDGGTPGARPAAATFEYTDEEWASVWEAMAPATRESERRKALQAIAGRYLQYPNRADIEAARVGRLRRRQAARKLHYADLIEAIEVGDRERAKREMALAFLQVWLAGGDRGRMANNAKPDTKRLLISLCWFWEEELGQGARGRTDRKEMPFNITSEAGGPTVEFLRAAAGPVVWRKNSSEVTANIARHAIRAFQPEYYRYVWEERGLDLKVLRAPEKSPVYSGLAARLARRVDEIPPE